MEEVYIYIYSTKHKKAKLLKNDVVFEKWVKFLDKCWDDGCQITASDSSTFKNSNGKYTLTNSTYNSLFDNLF